MRKLRRKLNLKSILSATLVCALLVGSVFGLTSVLGKKEKTISPFAFSQGAVNEKGIYEESKTSIYTKELIECQGLTITPDFEASGTYQVFYYDENKNFIGATDDLNAEDGAYTKGNTFEIAKYARIMITPDVPTDENGKKVEDFKIRFYEVNGYAKDYTITVNKKQNFNFNNLFKLDTTMVNKAWGLNEDYTLKVDDSNSDLATCEFIDVSKYDVVKMYVPLANASGPYMHIFVTEDHSYVEHKVNYTGYTSCGNYAMYEFAVPEGAQFFVTSLPSVVGDAVIIIGQ